VPGVCDDLSTARRKKLSKCNQTAEFKFIKVLFHSALDDSNNGQWLCHGVVMALFPLLTLGAIGTENLDFRIVVEACASSYENEDSRDL
jgi:hypothetical protein